MSILARMVEEVIVFDVDEKLSSRTVWVHGAGHSESVAVVLQAIVCFILNWVVDFLLFHIGRETTALDHEVVDDSVKYGAFVEAALCVLLEVLSSIWGIFEIQLNRYITEICVQSDHHRLL